MNLYEILGLDYKCEKQEIKKAYKKLVLQHHPDKNNIKYSNEKFIKISHAYQILYNDESRKKYDNNIHINCIDFNELFESFYENNDAKLKSFILSTFKNIDKNTFINSMKILNNYIFSDNINEQNISENNILNVKLSNLTNINKILLSINFIFINQYYNINIIDNSKIYKVKFNTEYISQNIIINNNTYHFILNDIIHKFLKRINTYDLYTKINIGIEDYFEGFLFQFNYLNNFINKNIKLTNSCLVKFQNMGFPIWSNNTFGDLYIEFKIINKKRLYPKITKTYYIDSNKTEILINNIKIYN